MSVNGQNGGIWVLLSQSKFRKTFKNLNCKDEEYSSAMTQENVFFLMKFF